MPHLTKCHSWTETLFVPLSMNGWK
jgi:hypothetical protein